MAVYNDGRMTVGGTIIPTEVIDAITSHMQEEKTFTTHDLVQTAIQVFDELDGPKSASFSVVERVVRNHRRNGYIVRVGVDDQRRYIYSWAA